MLQVSPTTVPNLYVRSDGFVSLHGETGPWARGTRVCINSDLVRLKGRTPKYYYVVIIDYQFLYVHRLVALAFCENPNEAEFRLVDHISGDSLSNAASNLRWLNHQLNSMNLSATRNCYRMKQSKKWRATVTINGHRYRWGYFKTYRQAHLSAQEFKAVKFTEIYRSFISNETETTRTCQYIHGRPGPTVHGPPVHNPRVCGACLLSPTQHCVCNPLPPPGPEDTQTPATVAMSPKTQTRKQRNNVPLDEARHERVQEKQEGRPGRSNEKSQKEFQTQKEIRATNKQ